MFQNDIGITGDERNNTENLILKISLNITIKLISQLTQLEYGISQRKRWFNFLIGLKLLHFSRNFQEGGTPPA